MIKVNDVIEVTMSINAVDDQELELKEDIFKCKRRFDIMYSSNDEFLCSVDYEIDEDDYVQEYDEIDEFIKDDFKRSFKEVAEFEIFDVDNKDCFYQKAKIKVTKLRVDVVNDFFEKYAKNLTAREKDVLRLRLGLDDGIFRTIEELAQLFGVDKKDIEENFENGIEKMDISIVGYHRLLRCIFGNDIASLFDLNLIKLVELTNETLELLDEREREVLELRLGMIDNKDLSCRAIGEKLGISGERVRQIESKALRTLRHPKRCEQLRRFIKGY